VHHLAIFLIFLLALLLEIFKSSFGTVSDIADTLMEDLHLFANRDAQLELSSLGHGNELTVFFLLEN
jgi:hypothetical protein